MDTSLILTFPLTTDEHARFIEDLQFISRLSEKAKERIEAGRETLADESLSPKDLKPGDSVMVGYSSSDNAPLTIIRKDELAK